MNPTIQQQLKHRTIRFFKESPVDPSQLEQILDVMNRTATSSGLQSYSVIRITDQTLKEQIAAVCRQAYIAQTPELFIFLVDNYRNSEIARAKGNDTLAFGDMNNFFQGAADVYLAAQNMTNAIESLGLGAVFLGSVLNDVRRMINILQLPPLTFPLLGLAFGQPDDSPQLKPCMDLALKVGENSYPQVADYSEALASYDQEMTHYYDTRDKNRRSDTFSQQVIQKQSATLPLRKSILKVAQEQGFDLGLGD